MAVNPPGPIGSSETILKAFNGQLDLRDAYAWNRDEVFNFLDRVIMTPASFGVPSPVVSELATIRREIADLSLPNGREYENPQLRPDQNILRIPNPKWSEATPRGLKFCLEVSHFQIKPYQMPQTACERSR